MFDSIKFIIEDIALLISVLFILYIVYYSIKFYQDSHYKIRDFLSYQLIFYRRHYYYLLIIPFIFILDKYYFQLIYIIFLIGIYFLMSRRKVISKLRFTSRIIRLYVFIIISWTALGTLLMMLISFNHLLSLLALYIVVTPPLLLISNLVMIPIENLINKFYHLQAKRKLKKYQPQIIGITGSCGKTSVKNYLFELLKEKYLVFMSPKSYNTVNGISMTLNQYLMLYNSLFILEIGATKVGDITELVNFTHPQYAIITEIVPQHLQTFKSIENIVQEKMQLVELLPSDGVAFINYDNKYLRNYKIQNDCKVITYGSTNDCDIYASNILMTLESLKFDVHYKDETFTIESKLLGRHNVNNLLAAIAFAKYIGVSNQEIADRVYQIEPVSHRLELKKGKDFLILDDAYNSNYLGFKNALEVLNLANDYKILLTPGIVELGKATKEIHYDLAKEIAKVCDEVILIDCPSSLYLYQGLRELGYKNVRVVKSYREGYTLINKGIVLIENDLPDNYFI